VKAALFAVNPGAAIHAQPPRTQPHDCPFILEWLEDLRLGKWTLGGDPWLKDKANELPPLLSGAAEHSFCRIRKFDGVDDTVSNQSSSQSLLHAKTSFHKSGFAQLPLDMFSKQLIQYGGFMLQYQHRGGLLYRDGGDAGAETVAILARTRRAVDNPRLFVFMANLMKPVVEQIVGRALDVSFTKGVVYSGSENGTKLPRHRDQVCNAWQGSDEQLVNGAPL